MVFLYFILFFLTSFTYCFSEETPKYYSQFLQDKYLNEKVFMNKKHGVFIDIGAHDGVLLSNTYFFEKTLDWTGICIEPLPEVFDRLEKNRTSICINGCVTETRTKVPFLKISGYSDMLSGIIDKYDPEHLKRIEHEQAVHGGTSELVDVEGYPLNALLEFYGIYHVDFISLDTEGGELDILKSIDFSRFQVDVIVVENNYSVQFNEFLSSKGYIKITNLGCDEIYVKKTL